MLYIKSGVIDEGKGSTQNWTVWHVGEALPPITSPVVSFQADGDELEIILQVLSRRFRQAGD